MGRRVYGSAVALLLVTSLGFSGCAKQPKAVETPSMAPASSSATTAAPSSTSAKPTSAKPTPTPTPTPTPPKILLAQGSSSPQVRELQARLRQLDLFPYYDLTDGFGPLTQEAVTGFQTAQKLQAPQPGAVDEKTWAKLLEVSKQPSADELKNMDPGPAFIADGNKLVKELQHRLKQLGVFDAAIEGTFGPKTTEAVKAFQKADGLYVNGIVDHRTWDHLAGQTRTPTEAELNGGEVKPKATGLDPRCMSGTVVCVSMNERKTRLVVGGTVTIEMDARFGSEGPDATYPGEFWILRKEENSWSKPYGVNMPWTLYFDYEGRAFHYSSAFENNGYNGASHGCVQSRDKPTQEAFYHAVPVGTKVIIY